MFLYHFEQYAGTDRVFMCAAENIKAGDLLMAGGGGYSLVLGEYVAWREQYTKIWKIASNSTSEKQVQVEYAGLLGEKSLEVLHWFVNEWYTTYKNSIGLWIHDIDDILKRSPSTNRKKKKKILSPLFTLSSDIKSTQQVVLESEEVLGQQLIVFPDIWSLTQCISQEVRSRKDICILHGKSTKKQKSEAFWGIKTGKIAVLMCTYSQIFQDRQDLKYITIVDAHTWYYKHYQDPRYTVSSVLERMSVLYEAKFTKVGNTLEIPKDRNNT